MVDPPRIERGTSAMSMLRSNQLSYESNMPILTYVFALSDFSDFFGKLIIRAFSLLKCRLTFNQLNFIFYL